MTPARTQPTHFRPGDATRAEVGRPPLGLLATGDAALVARIRDGDATAFDVVFASCYAALCQFALTLVDGPEAAEDAVQDALMHVWRGRARIELRGSSLRSYLFGAVRHRALDLARRDLAERRRADRWQRNDSRETPGLGDPGQGIEERMEQDEVRAAVQGAVKLLPERSRTVVVLRWEHRLSYAEIAHATGSNVKAVEMQLYRALRFLRSHLGAAQ